MELFISQTGYEQFKNTGFNIVGNERLRMEILNLYEATYPKMLSNYKMVNRYMVDFEDYIVQNFIFSGGELDPVSYQDLYDDHYYISWIRAYLEGRKHLINVESDLSGETKRILDLIYAELGERGMGAEP